MDRKRRGNAVATAQDRLEINSDLLTVGEIATKLRVSRMTVYRLVEIRDLESMRVGRSIRVRQSWLDAYLAKTDKVRVIDAG